MSKYKFIEGREVVVFTGRRPSETTSIPFTEPAKNYSANLLELNSRELRRKEEELQRRNSIAKIDDPVDKIDKGGLVSSFESNRKNITEAILSISMDEASSLSSLGDVQDIVISIIGDSVDIDSLKARKIISALYETKLIQELASRIGISNEAQKHLLRRYIDREWGPQPDKAPGTTVNVNNSDKPVHPRGKRAPNVESNDSRVVAATSATRKNPRISVGPFGALPTEG